MSRTIRNRPRWDEVFIGPARHHLYVRNRETRDKRIPVKRMLVHTEGIPNTDDFAPACKKNTLEKSRRLWMKRVTRERIADYLEEQEEEFRLLLEQEQDDEWSSTEEYEWEDYSRTANWDAEPEFCDFDEPYHDWRDDDYDPDGSLYEIVREQQVDDDWYLLSLRERVSMTRWQQLYLTLEEIY